MVEREGIPSRPTLPSAEPTSRDSALTQSEISRVVFYGLLCGATSLIPVPFLDDWIFHLLRRFIARDLLTKAGIPLSSAEARLLTRRPSVWAEKGCLYTAGYFLVLAPLSAAWYVLKKIFRKILILFMIKEATDRAVWSFHEAYLLLFSGCKRSPAWPSPDARVLAALRSALDETLAETDTSALSHVFRAVIKLNRKTMVQAGRILVKTWSKTRTRKTGPQTADEKSAIIQDERDLLEEMTQKAAEKILGETGYLADLEARFERAARWKGIF